MERFVQSFKQALKASKDDGSMEQRIYSYLLTYRSSSHATTGVSPASLFLHQALQTRFDLLRPNVRSNVLQRQAAQKANHDKGAKERGWSVGDEVWARSFRSGPSWIRATVVEKLGPVTYTVRIPDGQCWKRHAEQLKNFVLPHSKDNSSMEEATDSTMEFPAMEIGEPPEVELEDPVNPHPLGVPVLLAVVVE